ncbi:MAG: hypothetical protein R3B90_14420 [Planctomycetaceae bacterium]
MFICVRPPTQGSQVTHRFEAEATEPLVAVEQVLAQVEGWLERQFAER